MKKQLLTLVLFLWATLFLHSQTRVFTNVSKDIKSTYKTIIQNGKVIGYLNFTRLEKVNADSFSYKILIIDENLNDIGSVEFKNTFLDLDDLTFESDLLHLAYHKTNQTIVETKNKRGKVTNTKRDEQYFVVLQTINLEGKILKTVTEKLPQPEEDRNITYIYSSYRETNRRGLNSRIQINGIDKKGFTCFYKTKDSAILKFYNTNADLVWSKSLKVEANYFLNTNTEKYSYLLYDIEDADRKSKTTGLKFSHLQGFDLATGNKVNEYKFIDPKSEFPLEILYMFPDKKTGGLAVAGKIYQSFSHKNTLMENRKQNVTGLFTLLFDDETTKKPKETFTYWSDKSLEPVLTKEGRLANDDYPLIKSAFRDYDGNTLFVGYGVSFKTRIGNIFGTILTLPSPLICAIVIGHGYRKVKLTDGYVFKQKTDGKLELLNTVEMSKVRYQRYLQYRREPKSYRSLFSTSNDDLKYNYVVYDDGKDYQIFNTTANKVIKKIPSRNKKVDIEIVPAKEGHLMIVEFNAKSGTTTLSIESIQ